METRQYLCPVFLYSCIPVFKTYNRNMKKEYINPSVLVVLVQHRTTLLAGSNPVINPDEPNKPAGARGFDGFDDWDE